MTHAGRHRRPTRITQTHRLLAVAALVVIALALIGAPA